MPLPFPRIALVLLGALLSGCPGDGWHMVLEEQPAGFVSVWGTGPQDVWVVGGNVDDGGGPWVLRYDGDAWTRLRTPGEGDLWWVHGFADDGPVFLGGAGGQILRFQDGAFERMTTPGTDTVFGIWGTSPEDLWAVGGTGTNRGFAWRYDGTAWTDVPLPDGLASRASLFKVWGTRATDVTFVGSGGTVLHHDGTGFTGQPSGTTRTLFTVHAQGDRAVAVGGFGSGTLLEREGPAATAEWRDVTPEGARQLIGAWLTEDGGGFAVGANGYIARREGGTWVQEETGIQINRDLHAVWLDSSGGIWAVGGAIASLPLTDGVIVHHGERVADALREE